MDDDYTYYKGQKEFDANTEYAKGHNFPITQEMKQDRFNNSVGFLKDKYDVARRIGKTGDADSIQAWNGYGKVFLTDKNKTYYGLDRDKLPTKQWNSAQDKPINVPYIDMKENPMYGKTIVNLRDSVIKQSPDIQNMIQKGKEYFDYENSKKKNQMPIKRGQYVESPVMANGGLLKASDGGESESISKGRPYGEGMFNNWWNSLGFDSKEQ